MASITNFAAVDVAQKVVRKEMIEILEQNLVFYKLGDKAPIPKGSNSKTMIFRKWSKQPLISTPLTEGVVPAGNPLVMTSVTVSTSQYGDFTSITDIMAFLFDRSATADASGVLAIQAQESIDTLVVGVVAAGTNVVYGDGTVSARASVTGSMTLTTTLLRRATRFLERNNVHKFSSPIGGISNAFACVGHPDVFYDIRGDTNFVNAVNYSSPDPKNPLRGDLFNGELGYWMGNRLIQSTNAPVYAAAGSGSPAATIYATLVFGEGAYAVTELASGLEVFVKTGGPQDTSNPLDQFMTVGWKWSGAAIILDQVRLVRLETSATLTGAAA